MFQFQFTGRIAVGFHEKSKDELLSMISQMDLEACDKIFILSVHPAAGSSYEKESKHAFEMNEFSEQLRQNSNQAQMEIIVLSDESKSFAEQLEAFVVEKKADMLILGRHQPHSLTLRKSIAHHFLDNPLTDEVSLIVA